MTSTPTTGRRTDRRVIDVLSKVPQVTLAFWVIKILATTLGRRAAMPCR